MLNKSVQPAVAANLGWHDRSPSERLEKFMKVYYTHARNIDLITRTVEQRLALVPAAQAALLRLPGFLRPKEPPNRRRTA